MPPKGIPPKFIAAFGPLIPATCIAVARFVDREAPRLNLSVDGALAHLREKPEYAFERTKGFAVLKAGRFLLHKKEGRKVKWPTKRA